MKKPPLRLVLSGNADKVEATLYTKRGKVPIPMKGFEVQDRAGEAGVEITLVLTHDACSVELVHKKTLDIPQDIVI